MKQRVAVVGATIVVVLSVVVGAVAAAPGPEVELRAAYADTETEKYLGDWTELTPDNHAGDATGSLRLIGTEKDPARESKPDLLTGKVDFGGAEHCPADIEAAATKAVETIKERSRSFDPDKTGQKDGYNPQGEGEVTDSNTAAGDFRAIVEDEKHNGETFQQVSVKGQDPACAVGDGPSARTNRASLEELIYKLLAQFSRGHRREGTSAARAGGLEEQFSGMLKAKSPDLNEDVRIAVQAELIR